MSVSPVCRVLLPVLLFAAAPAMADPGNDRGRGNGPEARATRVHDQRPDPQSLAEAVRRVERATGGRILSAERVPFDGRDMNRIKVLDSTGRVRVITEDPRGPAPTRRDDD
ncbi:PepSY domain-containing protein [Lysobacter humi (ex Lee et al. 2017)]